MNNPTRELDMNPTNSGNARHRTEYTDGDDGRYDKSDRERERRESILNERR